MKNFAFFTGLGCVSVLAGCSATMNEVTPGRATLGDVEQACVNRLAQTANVSTSVISISESTGSSEGTAVFLSLNGAPWVCRANGAGVITSVEFQGAG